MKINQMAFKLAALVTAATLLCSCDSIKSKSQPADDCSRVFEKSNSAANETPRGTCKTLSVKISDEAKCKISGSNSVDGFLQEVSKNKETRIVAVVPIKKWASELSYPNQLKYYYFKLKFKEHFESDLFATLTDFRYKGMNCEFAGSKLTAWIGEGRVITAFEGDENVKKKGSDL